MVTLRQENVDLKTKLDYSDMEGAYLGYEISTSKNDSLEANDRLSRLEMGMEDFQKALKERQDTMLSLECQIATL